MATKPTRKKSAEPYQPSAPRKNVEVFGGQTEAEGRRNYAALVLSPELAAYRVVMGADGRNAIGEGADVPTLIAQLREQAVTVNGGNLGQAEAMLMNQATALQSLFARLAERGMGHDSIPGFEVNMRMALRAQSQCRATLETLAAIKNPPVIYAKQANFAHGPQQVNNGTLAGHVGGKNTIDQNKLSEEGHELLPDARASQAESRVNQNLEALGEIDRAEVGGR